MVKRLFDIVFSFLALVLLSPVFVFASIGIAVASRGPIFYKANRAGIRGKPFTMHKFRTMHVSNSNISKITGIHDDRIFPFGDFLRAIKVDELPQLYDILIGSMSIVGPRPEDVSIVNNYYSAKDMETLSVKPGLASPGSIFNYTHAEEYLDDNDPENTYIEKLLPVKLAIERVYIENQSFLYDLKIILRTVVVIFLKTFGKKVFKYPWELAQVNDAK